MKTHTKTHPARKGRARHADLTPALRKEPNTGVGSDYILKDGHSCWITVDGVSIHISRLIEPGYVTVEMYPRGMEADMSPEKAVSCSYSFEQARQEVAEYDKALVEDCTHEN